MNQIEIFNTPNQEVAQHNNLIFAPYALGSIESKIFISMLERIDRNADHFTEWRIPINEIIKHSGGTYYEELKKARENLVGYVVDIASTRPDGKRSSKPRTIIYKCDHDEGRGFIICQFHEHMREYLLKLLGNFTRADLSVLKNFKDEKSVRFYWMLKARFFNKEKVSITVEECRNCLLPKNSTSYPNPTELKKHVLERVIKPELETTDCAFEFGIPIKQGNKTIAWTFQKKAGSVTLLTQSPIILSAKLIEELEVCGMDSKGIRKINECLNKNQGGVLVDEGYIRYVIHIRKQEAKKKDIKNLAGYIVDTIIEGWLVNQYLSNHKKKNTYISPAEQKAEVMNEFSYITIEEAKLMYEEEKAAGLTKYPFPGFIRALKTGRKVLVYGHQY